MAHAGSKPYWIAYDAGYGSFEVAKVRNFDEEREYGKVIARNYKKTIVNKAARSATKRAERGLSNPANRSPLPEPGRKVKGGRAISLKNFTGTVTRKKDGSVLIRGRR